MLIVCVLSPITVSTTYSTHSLPFLKGILHVSIHVNPRLYKPLTPTSEFIIYKAMIGRHLSNYQSLLISPHPHPPQPPPPICLELILPSLKQARLAILPLPSSGSLNLIHNLITSRHGRLLLMNNSTPMLRSMLNTGLGCFGVL